jgi:uncharacterized protein YdeI (YjbR/CyaY-like superfamily)
MSNDENEIKRRLMHVRQEKERAISAQEFQRAAELREEETMLSESLRAVSAVKRDSVLRVGMQEVDFMAILTELQASLNRLEIRFDKLERRLLSE